MKKEKEYRGSNGYVAFTLLLLLLAAIIVGGILFKLIPLLVLIPFILFAFAGLVAINPN
jgi:hypothetical protein